MTDDDERTILLVEDEALIAMAERQTLERNGYRVDWASTGEKAVEIAAARPDIDLVLMDINLGRGMDGTEAAALILETRNLPVVFLSSHTDPAVVEKTERITSYGYIVKDSGETVLTTSLKMAFRLFESRKLAVAELAGEKERLRVTLQSVGDAVVATDAEGRVTFLNPVAERLTGYSVDGAAGRPLADAAKRLQAMSRLYDRLFRNTPTGPMSIRRFLVPLTDEIVGILSPLVPVHVESDVEDVCVDARTLTTIGIAVNELVTNSVKHAFAGQVEGRVFLTVSRNDSLIAIAYRDDGPGASREASLGATDGFGMQLVEMMVQNLGGGMRVRPDDGFRVELEIPDPSPGTA